MGALRAGTGAGDGGDNRVGLMWGAGVDDGEWHTEPDMRRNFLPGSDAELGLFTQRLLAVLTERPGVYGIVDPELAAYGAAQRG